MQTLKYDIYADNIHDPDFINIDQYFQNVSFPCEVTATVNILNNQIIREAELKRNPHTNYIDLDSYGEECS